MTVKPMIKAQIFWAPSLSTAQHIDDSDSVLAIEAARTRFTQSMRDLEQHFDQAAQKLRTAFLAEVAEHITTAGYPAHD